MFKMYILMLQIWILNGIYGSIQHIDRDESINRKRLLTNDPNVVNDKILELERKLQDFAGRVSSVETENAQLKSIIQTTNSDRAKLEQKVEKIAQKVESQTIRGTVYIRWGRKDCPNLNGTQLLYTGIAGGKPYHEIGNGANTLCLPHDPDYGKSDYPDSLQGVWGVGHIYGAEYQYNYRNIKLDDDVPCAVCVDIKGSTSLMIPGKTSCPTEWRKHYTGHVCSEHYNNKGPTEYTCVDDDAQYFEGTRQHDDNGRLFYPVETVCGSLPCPPYANSKYLKCVVCTK